MDPTWGKRIYAHVLDLGWGEYRGVGKTYEAISIENWKDEIAALGGDEAGSLILLTTLGIRKMETRESEMILPCFLAMSGCLLCKDA